MRFRWLTLGAVGGSAIAFLIKLLPGKRKSVGTLEASSTLQQLAKHTSIPVPKLAGELKKPAAEVLSLLDGLEEQGLVQLSNDTGSSSVRIAAITKAGRDRIAQGRPKGESKAST